MVEIIRNKWCEDLEDMLQCPICMVRPRSVVHQCVQGHHICLECKSQLSHCPTCSQRWSASRNRLAETLCAKLDDIKLSLIDPEGEINKLLVPNRVSVGTQTDGKFTADAAGPPSKKAGDEHTGGYPCRVGGCSVNMFFAPLMNHIKTVHFTQYLELPMGDGSVFQHTWPVDYKEQMTLDRAFQVAGMGVFFLKLSSDVFGNFTGFVLMLHNGYISKRFTYQLEMSCCQEHACAAYTGEVCSCRTPPAVMKEKSLQASRTEMGRMASHEKQLKCTVLIGKKPQTDEAEQSNSHQQQQQQQQKNRNPKYRNNGAGPGRGRGHSVSGGQASGPRGPPRPMENRQSRPQTAPDRAQPQPLFGGYQRRNVPPRDLPPRNRSVNRPPLNNASSISSLPSLYPYHNDDFHDF